MQYLGFTITHESTATQLGYQTATGKRGKGRKISAWFVSDADGRHLKTCDTLREAKAYVEAYD